VPVYARRSAAYRHQHGQDAAGVAEDVAAHALRRSVVAGRQKARSPWHLTSAFRRISQMCYKSVSGCAMTCART
jgi:hypothetical protein